MRFYPVLILLRPTGIALAEGTAIRAFLDRVLANGIGEHFGRELIRSGEVNLVSKIEKKDIGLFPVTHRRDIRRRGLSGVDCGRAGAANLVHHIVVGNTVLAYEHGFLGLIQYKDN